MSRTLESVLMSVLLAAIGCWPPSATEPTTPSATEPATPSATEPATPSATPSPSEPSGWPKLGAAPADVVGVPHLMAVSPRIAVGGRPDGRVGFQSLRRLGVAVVVSVDGQRPQLDAAHAAGLTYVHIPTGYDGVSPSAAAALARVVRQFPTQRIFIHCHHGQHRGPAAAAIALRADDPSCPSRLVLELLARAGTSRDYRGLWRDAVGVALPTVEEPLERLPPLPEAVEVRSLTAAMVELDETWQVLTALHRNQWKSRPEHPDQTPESSARRLTELLRSAAELPDAELRSTGRPAEHRALMRSAAEPAGQLTDALAAGRLGRASELMPTIRATCADCHKRFRN